MPLKLIVLFILTSLSFPGVSYAGQDGDEGIPNCGELYLTAHSEVKLESFETRISHQVKAVRAFANGRGLPSTRNAAIVKALFRTELLALEQHGPAVKIQATKLAQELLRIANEDKAKETFRQMVQSYQDLAMVRRVMARASYDRALHFISEMSHGGFESMPTDFETNATFLARLVENYPVLDLLSNEASPEMEGIPGPASDQSPSVILHRGFNKGFEVAVRSILNFLLIRKGGDVAFEAFNKSQPVALRLSRPSFDELHSRFARLFASVEDIHANIVFLSMNDIGKSKVLSRALGIFDLIADHDNVLEKAIDSDLLTDYQALPVKYRKLIRAGIRSKINIAQMRQGENNIASIEGGHGMGVLALEWFHANDIMHVGAFLVARFPVGAFTWTEALHRRDVRLLERLKFLASRRATAQETYDGFLSDEARELGLPDVNADPVSKAATRMALMLRSFSSTEARAIYEKLQSRSEGPSIVRSLNATGQTGGFLIYYAPAFWAKFRDLKDDHGAKIEFSDALDLAFPIYRRILLEAQYYGLAENVKRYIVVNIEKLTTPGVTLQQFRDHIIELVPTGDGGADAMLVPIAETAEDDRFLLSPLQIQQFVRVSRSWALKTVAAQDETMLRNTGLTTEEIVALWAYQNTMVARELCRRMRTSGGLDDPQFARLARLIDSALIKLETAEPSHGYPGVFSGMVFRLVRYPESLIESYRLIFERGETLSLGGIPPLDAIVSAAENLGNQERWLQGVNLKIIINATRVAPIAPFGTMADRQMQGAAELVFEEDGDYNRAMLGEVLFRTGTYFRVISMRKNAKGIWEMFVEQAN